MVVPAPTVPRQRAARGQATRQPPATTTIHSRHVAGMLYGHVVHLYAVRWRESSPLAQLPSWTYTRWMTDEPRDEPELLDQRVPVMLSASVVTRIDAFRKSLGGFPSRGFVMRRLIEAGLVAWRVTDEPTDESELLDQRVPVMLSASVVRRIDDVRGRLGGFPSRGLVVRRLLDAGLTAEDARLRELAIESGLGPTPGSSGRKRKNSVNKA